MYFWLSLLHVFFGREKGLPEIRLRSQATLLKAVSYMLLVHCCKEATHLQQPANTSKGHHTTHQNTEPPLRFDNIPFILFTFSFITTPGTMQFCVANGGRSGACLEVMTSSCYFFRFGVSEIVFSLILVMLKQKTKYRHCCFSLTHDQVLFLYLVVLWFFPVNHSYSLLYL